MLSLTHLLAKLLLGRKYAAGLHLGVKSAVNLNPELLCGDRLLFKINVRKGLILVLKHVAPVNTPWFIENQ